MKISPNVSVLAKKNQSKLYTEHRTPPRKSYSVNEVKLL